MRKQKSDDVLNEYWAEPRRFADLFNGILFGGKQVLKPEDLHTLDTANPTTVVQGSKKKESEDIYSLTRYRDLVKMAGYGAEFRIITAVENQSKIHYAMPVRGLLYDALGYTRQCKNIATSHDKSDYEDAAEYLSGLMKEDKLIPIFTVTLYYGEKPWDGPKALSDMMGVDKNLQSYYNDYKLNLISVRDYVDCNKFQTEVAQFFQLMQSLRDLESISRYMEEDREEMIDVDTVRAVAVAAEAKDLHRLVMRQTKGGKIKVCTAIEELKAKGKYMNLIEQVRKKVAKNVSKEACADMLEESIDLISKIYTQIEANPTLDDEAIYVKLQEI